MLHVALFIIFVVMGLWMLNIQKTVWWGVSLLVGACLYLVGMFFIENHPAVISTLFVLYVLLLVSFFLTPTRRIFSKLVMVIMEKAHLIPSVSKSEREVLFSGSPWIERDFFQGTFDWKKIKSHPISTLTPDEKSFLDNEVNAVCEMTNDWDVWKNRDLPKEVWDYLREKKFFSMLIPKEWGGLGFSSTAQSLVIQRLASRSYPLAISVMVPNSLGPGELLVKYGTDAQKKEYLPGLASGKDIPCFGLTEPFAGSDATAIQSYGVLFKKDGKLFIRLNFEKRYITLSTIASLVGVAFQLKDPENLLGKGEDVGITLAIVRRDTEGLEISKRHDPMGVPFFNSPIFGKNVVVSADAIIGGIDEAGKGWKMLSECLAVGRGISLPSVTLGSSKGALRVLNAYTNIRRQFNTEIRNFEGVQGIYSGVIADVQMLEYVNRYSLSALDRGIKPPVVTAINKYHFTETARKNINNAMDIMGGSAIMNGPKNLLAHSYQSTPIAITVEGANILTRSLLHYGQSLMVAHPHLYPLMEGIENNDIELFDRHLWQFVSDTLYTVNRHFMMTVTKGFFYPSLWRLPKYQRKMHWATNAFAALANLSVLVFGGGIKRKEMISGKMGDLLSTLYMLSASMSLYEDEGKPETKKNTYRYIMENGFNTLQKTLLSLYANIFTKWLRPFGYKLEKWSSLLPIGKEVTDNLRLAVVKESFENQNVLEALCEDAFFSKDGRDATHHLVKTAKVIYEDKTIAKTLVKIERDASITGYTLEEKLQTLANKGSASFSKEEGKKLLAVFEDIRQVVDVDSFTPEEYQNR